MNSIHLRRHTLALLVAALTTSTASFADSPIDWENDYTATADQELQAVTPLPITSENAAPQDSSQEAPLVAPVAYECAPSVTASADCNCKGNEAAKKKKEEAMAKMKAAYAGVFFGNDFSYLDNPAYDGPSFFGDSFKRLCDGRLDVGGETRYRYHSEENHRGLGLTGRDDNFWLSRQRLFANWRVCDDVRLFAEAIHADSHGETFAPRPIEENSLDLLNLLVDVKLFDDDFGKMLLRGGRQELIYGNQRLVSPLDWANTRRTFDGFRSLYTKGNLQLDTFYTQPVIVDNDNFDNPDENQHLYGLYATLGSTPIGLTDLYYIGYDNENEFNAARRTGNFSFHTIGTRVVGDKAGWLYEFEGGFQFGENNGGSSHSAGFVTGGLGRKVELANWKPTFWGWYDWASGEDDFDQVAEGDNGFHHLFPLAHKYNGFMDLFGRRNLHDINAQMITPISEKVSLVVWYHYFLLDELTTPYSVVMTPFSSQVGAGRAGDRELGSEIDVLFNINLTPRRNVQIGYSHFAAGDYYRTTPGVPTDDDAQFLWAQFQVQY